MDFKRFIGKDVRTSSGVAHIESVMGKYATLSYSVGGIGWLDLTSEFELITKKDSM